MVLLLLLPESSKRTHLYIWREGRCFLLHEDTGASGGKSRGLPLRLGNIDSLEEGVSYHGNLGIHLEGEL